MNYCKLEWKDDSNCWQCTVCGNKYRLPKESTNIFAECPAAKLPQKIKNYAKAVVQHVFTGMETRTDEEVSNILEICKQCEHFNSNNNSCRICGCRCNRNKSAFTNKLRMKSQQCPKGKWK